MPEVLSFFLAVGETVLLPAGRGTKEKIHETFTVAGVQYRLLRGSRSGSSIKDWHRARQLGGNTKKATWESKCDV